MTSPLLAAFEQRLTNLEAYFIVRRSDYSQYTAEDFTKALAYRLLASAALESYVEERCIDIATRGCDRLTKSQPTATGRALVTWLRTQDRRVSKWMYIHEVDPITYPLDAEPALKTYTRTVKKSHGIDREDLQSLVYPLGLRESQVPEVLLNSLHDLADKRNPASHSNVRSRTEPAQEVKMINQILEPLRHLDADLETVCTTWPVSHL